jgi:hypothetical protein
MPAAESSLRITEAYRSRLFAIRGGLIGRATAIWGAAGDLTDTSWTNRAASALEIAQGEAVTLTGAYLTAFLTSETGSRTRGPTLDTRAYSGLSRDGRALRESLRSPMIGTRLKLKEGASVEEALKFGLDRAKRMVSVDYDHAHRTALLDGLAADERFQGWQRAVTGTCGACAGDIAVEVSTNLPSIPLQVHPNCQCVTEPVVATRSPEDVIKPGPYRLSLDGQDGVTAYQESSEIGAINSILRGRGVPEGVDLSESTIQRMMANLETAVNEAGPVGAPVKVWRGVKSKIDKYFPELRGLSDDDLVGKVLIDRGYGSTTGKQGLAEDFALGGGDLFELNVHPAVRAIYMPKANPSGKYFDEQELLLNKGVRIRITKVVRERMGYREVRRIYADVLPA